MNYKHCPNCGFKLESEPEKVSGSDENFLQEYATTQTKEGVEIAQPKYLDNKKRLMQLRQRPAPIIQPKTLDGGLDSITYKGERLSIGEGVTQSF